MKSAGKYLKVEFLVMIALLILFQTCMPLSSYASTVAKPPSIPGELSAVNVTHTSISLSWSPPQDDTTVKGYQVYRDGKKILSTSKTSYINTDLVPGRKYTYTVKAYDAVGNLSVESNTLTIATLSDTQAPSIPGSLSVLSTSYTSVTLTWSPSADNTSVKGYEICCSGKKAAITSATYYACKGLMPGKTYTFSVKAYDIAGNYSIQSSSISAGTIFDSTAPSIPNALKTTSISETEINLSWSPSIDNVKIKTYEITRDGLKIGSTSKTIYCSKGLIPGRSYSYTVSAIDSTGNKSGFSIPLTIATVKDTEPPTAPTGLKVNSVNGSSVSLKWNSSSDNTKIKGYNIYCNGFKIANTSRTSLTVKNPVGMGLDFYWVKAYDLAGNLSDSSNCVPVIMLK